MIMARPVVPQACATCVSFSTLLQFWEGSLLAPATGAAERAMLLATPPRSPRARISARPATDLPVSADCRLMLLAAGAKVGRLISTVATWLTVFPARC